MIDITVIRGEGLNPGEDIVDVLCATEAVAIQRGRNAVDANAKITPVRLQTVYRAGLETGQTVQVLDSLQGEAWLGKIVDVSLAVEGPVLSATLEVEKV